MCRAIPLSMVVIVIVGGTVALVPRLLADRPSDPPPTRIGGLIGQVNSLQAELNRLRKEYETRNSQIDKAQRKTEERINQVENASQAGLKATKDYNGRIEWRTVSQRIDRDGTLGPIDFRRPVVEAEFFLKGVYLTYTRDGNHRIDHNVDTIRVQIGPARIDGTTVTATCSNYMHDDQAFNGDHCSNGDVTFVVVARVR